MARSLAFYTEVLDFIYVEGDGTDRDPSFSVIKRDGGTLFLSSHSGDGSFGQRISVLVEDVDALFWKYRSSGLVTPGNPNAPVVVHDG